MNKEQLIKDFRHKAEIAGKPFTTQNGRHGTRVVCDGQALLLPPHNREVRNAHYLARRLGLHARQLAKA